MMLRKIPDDPGYSQQELALLRECLLELLRVQDGRLGVCGTLHDMLAESSYAKPYHVYVDGYAFCRYAAYSWEHTIFAANDKPSAYFIDTNRRHGLWVGSGLELRIDFMKHCLGVVAKLESELGSELP